MIHVGERKQSADEKTNETQENDSEKTKKRIKMVHIADRKQISCGIGSCSSFHCFSKIGGLLHRNKYAAFAARIL